MASEAHSSSALCDPHGPSKRILSRRRGNWFICVPVLISVTVALAGRRVKASPPGARTKASFKIWTTAFAPGGTIPKLYTCEGKDVSPPLAWTAPPAGTRSLVLMLLDPDAPGGTWTHWLVYNLPGTAGSLAANVPKAATLPDGAHQGRNDFGNLGFGGPCPPPGKPHHYVFHLLALNVALDLPPGETRHNLEQAIQGHILAQAQLTGRFGR